MRKIKYNKKAIKEGRLLLTKIDGNDLTDEFVQCCMCSNAIKCGIPEDLGIKAFTFYRGMSLVEVAYRIGDTGIHIHVIQDKNRFHPSYPDEASAYIREDVERFCKERGDGLLPLYQEDLEKGNMIILFVRKSKKR